MMVYPKLIAFCFTGETAKIPFLPTGKQREMEPCILQNRKGYKKTTFPPSRKVPSSLDKLKKTHRQERQEIRVEMDHDVCSSWNGKREKRIRGIHWMKRIWEITKSIS